MTRKENSQHAVHLEQYRMSPDTVGQDEHEGRGTKSRVHCSGERDSQILLHQSIRASHCPTLANVLQVWLIPTLRDDPLSALTRFSIDMDMHHHRFFHGIWRDVHRRRPLRLHEDCASLRPRWRAATSSRPRVGTVRSVCGHAG